MFDDSFACWYEQVKDVFKGIIDVLEVRLLDHTSRNRLTIGFNRELSFVIITWLHIWYACNHLACM
jgi:hypothetical protein